VLLLKCVVETAFDQYNSIIFDSLCSETSLYSSLQTYDFKFVKMNLFTCKMNWLTTLPYTDFRREKSNTIFGIYHHRSLIKMICEVLKTISLLIKCRLLQWSNVCSRNVSLILCLYSNTCLISRCYVCFVFTG